MNKRGLRLGILSTFILILYSFAVQARVTDIISRFGEFLFRDIPAMGDYGFKFLLWIVLFTLFHYALNKIFDAKPAGVIAFVISLGTVILIPSGAIQRIFGIWMSVILLIMGLLVVGIGFYFTHAYFGGTSRVHRIMRGIVYTIMAYSFAQYLQNPGLVGI